jgi:GDP-mannose 6-dehydrogenase
MKIVVCGLGHVGSVNAACLLGQGHRVIALDANDDVRNRLAQGLSPVHEAEVAELIAAGHAAGRLCVTADAGEHADAAAAIVCVGTPGRADGAADLSDVEAAARHLGAMARRRPQSLPPLLMVFRSTMPPGSMRKTILPAIATAAGEPPGARYEVAYSPEFTREGSAVDDYLNPARIVIGEREPGIAAVLRTLYEPIDAPMFATTFEVAELAKYADNVFHALKIAFANEIGRYAIAAGLPPDLVSDVFLADTRLNLSAAYLRPGSAFGGPCLPKDVRAFRTHLRDAGIAAPVIEHILESNAQHQSFTLAEIERRVGPGDRVLLSGLSFKAGTRDLRESPLVALAEFLLDRGCALSIYDPDLACDPALGHLDLAPAAKLSAVLLREPPEKTHWTLVIVGKTFPGLAPVLRDSPVLRLDGA